MRKQFCDAMVARSADPNVLFLTGDLGFMALEPLRDAMAERFINAGVAEQNMVSVAAALAGQGFEVWVYSIAPFCYARPFEQIRNDVAFHNQRVRLVGNGGGYGYGVQGPTHHAIEDYGVLLGLPNMTAFVPAFDEDIPDVVQLAGDAAGPCYVRLGRGEPPPTFEYPGYASWRRLVRGANGTVIAVGPLAGTYIACIEALPFDRRPSLWALAHLPVVAHPPPEELLRELADGGGLCVAEEHVRQGGAASQIALYLAEQGVGAVRIRSLHARAHFYDRSGSQTYLRRLSQLDPDSLREAIAW
jgi:transketolase